uniref:DUF7083 domain-containing protein n=1 Tax=Trichuris muris TaxID=70415 RepID=A0A5S6QKS7_TRIMR
MSHSKTDLQSILALQQRTLQQFAEFQEQFAETVQRLSLAQASSAKVSNAQPTLDTLAASVTEFDYDPSTDDTFEAWFSRYEDFFNVEAAELDDSARVRLLLRKLRTNVHKKVQDINFTSGAIPRTFGYVYRLASGPGAQCTSERLASYICALDGHKRGSSRHPGSVGLPALSFRCWTAQVSRSSEGVGASFELVCACTLSLVCDTQHL